MNSADILFLSVKKKQKKTNLETSIKIINKLEKRPCGEKQNNSNKKTKYFAALH